MGVQSPTRTGKHQAISTNKAQARRTMPDSSRGPFPVCSHPSLPLPVVHAAPTASHMRRLQPHHQPRHANVPYARAALTARATQPGEEAATVCGRDCQGSPGPCPDVRVACCPAWDVAQGNLKSLNSKSTSLLGGERDRGRGRGFLAAHRLAQIAAGSKARTARRAAHSMRRQVVPWHVVTLWPASLRQ